MFSTPFVDFDDVPTKVAEAVHAANGGQPWTGLTEETRKKKESRAKVCLNTTAVSRMTIARLAQTDPQDEIKGWLLKIRQMMNSVES